MRLRFAFLLVLAAATRLYAQPAPALARPSYPTGGRSITVPFAVPVDFTHLDTTLKLLTSVNGGAAHSFTVDTGSVGVVLPATDIPGFNPAAPGNTPGQLRYASSGLTLDGFWTAVTVRFLDPGTQQPVAEAAVQVLAVTRGSCQGGGPNAGNCTGAIPHMLGVGFGRGSDSANGMRTQAGNPFVNLTAMNAPPPTLPVHPGEHPRPPLPQRPGARLLHGYLITHAGITFGLTGAETVGFQYVKLTPAADNTPALSSHSNAQPLSFRSNTQSLSFRSVAEESASAPAPTNAFSLDYNTAPGFFTLAGHSYPMGAVLIDTGLTNMIIEEPSEPGQPHAGTLPAGQPVVVHLLGNQLRYRFTTGDTSTPVAPRRASWAAYTHGPFVNTGLRALACFDYLYDAENGYLGLRSTCSAN